MGLVWLLRNSALLLADILASQYMMNQLNGESVFSMSPIGHWKV